MAILIIIYIGEALNIDPRKFYTHFYAILLQLDVGKWSSDN